MCVVGVCTCRCVYVSVCVCRCVCRVGVDYIMNAPDGEQWRPRIVVANTSCLHDAVRPACEAWLQRSGAGGRAQVTLVDAGTVIQDEETLVQLLDAHGAQAYVNGGGVQPAHPDRLPQLLAVCKASSGYEDLPLAAFTAAGIAACNAPVRELTESVADHTFGLMAALARRIPDMHARVSAGKGHDGYVGSMLWKKTLGIIGLGNIGKAVARRARGFDMEVLAVTPTHGSKETLAATAAFAAQYGVELLPLTEVLTRADIVSLHGRLEPGVNAEQSVVIGKSELSAMKPTASLINTARQAMVDEAALAEALAAGTIGGAAVDDPPKDMSKFRLPNVIVNPHMGNRSVESMVAVFAEAVESAIALVRMDGDPPAHLLNPEVLVSGARARRQLVAAL